jgi:chlorobactene glucosyltransferase
MLIPARNEEANIAACLAGLAAQDYPALEILVLDDHSTDRTAEIVQGLAEHDARVKLIKGAPLPSGWLGKNWACHQLGTQATGEILIFTDADTRHVPAIVSHTVGWMQKLELGMLSAFSQHVTKTLPEKLVTPLFDMFVYSYLPLWLTYFSRDPSLAAAHGHWIAFTRAAYTRLGGHAAVRGEIVEDVELSRLAKSKGEKFLTACGKGEVFGRMYGSFQEIWEGYSKNLFGLVRFQTIPFFIILALFVVIHLVPYFLVCFAPFAKWMAAAIAMNVALRGVLALKYDHPFVVSTVLHPLAIALIILIGINSYRWHKLGNIKWKGRQFAVSASYG